MASAPVEIGGHISIRDVNSVARHQGAVAMSSEVRDRLKAARDHLEAELARGATVYGANTGIGALCETRIKGHETDTLQINLLRSHAACVGPPLSDEAVRALLLVRAHTLALGGSAASPQVPQQLVAFLNHSVIPVVPSQGSVGASGDLGPLAHLALPLIGEGLARVAGQSLPGASALAAVGLKPLKLRAKEGLSLINGTQPTAAIGALAAWDAGELIAAADVIGALSLDAHLGSCRVCDHRVQNYKPYPGQRRSAHTIESLIRGSALNMSHNNCGRVQDAYSFRCMPQVHGAVREAHRYARDALAIEINSVSDNPLLLQRGDGGYDVVSGGNFHAASIALPLDHLTAALTTLGTISERRVARMINADTSRGLPAFLADRPGLETGFMMPHVTASALASECKSLSFPAAVDSIPTSAGQEDHVSMAPVAAHKLQRVIGNLARILAIEAATAARALDLRTPETSPALRAVHAEIRRHCPPFDGDRSMTAEVEALAQSVLAGELRAAAGVDPA